MKTKGAKFLKYFLIITGSVTGILLITVMGYFYHNLKGSKPSLSKTIKAGFIEKQALLDDGTILNYAEGPDNGPALLLIHGQGSNWQDYSTVLPELSRVYHVFAIDCHGHGKSSFNPEKYYADIMGEDFIWFIENVIGEPTVVSGHSSGGLLTAWLAANSPENVLGIVLEDPPLFSTEEGRIEKTFAWVDTFKTIHLFLNQDKETDAAIFYLKNCFWINYFGELKPVLVNTAVSFREKHPDEPLVIYYLPPSINRTFYFMETFDLVFGDHFYDASWNRNFKQAEVLEKINCPSVLIQTNWTYDENGILMGAFSGEDAQLTHELIKNNEYIKVNSGHDFHFEKPKDFTQIMIDFLEKIE